MKILVPFSFSTYFGSFNSLLPEISVSSVRLHICALGCPTERKKTRNKAKVNRNKKGGFMSFNDTSDLNRSRLAVTVPNLSSLDMRESVALINQITNLLADVAANPPLPGVPTTEIESQMVMLQSVLDPIKEHVAAMRMARKLKEQQHLEKVYRQRVETAEKTKKKNEETEKYTTEQQQRIKDTKSFYYQSLNKGVAEKASQCRARNEDALLSIINKGEETERSRSRRLEKLRRDRAMKQLELRRRRLENMERARSVYSRCHIQRTMEHLASQQAAEMRAKEVEAKLDSVRKSRISTVAARCYSRCDAKASIDEESARSLPNLKNYEELLEKLEAKHRQQQERCAEQKAAHLEYQRMRANYAANRHLRQKTNALRLIEENIARNEAIMERFNQKMQRIKQLKEAQISECKESRKNLIHDIEVHKSRADQIQAQREIDILYKNYRRWNHRGACMIEKVRRALYADGSESDSRIFGSAAGRD
ncbi:unnamed protein product [Phytomonas sp. EM1]|nr:unnamed protein product [Phytomonas sp. EM1]|eukprot:CCW61003.1 unnamed protein product [Phytomonas sp. isolate EM1]